MLGKFQRSNHLACEQLEVRRLLSVSPQNPAQLTDAGALLYFAATSTAAGEELWKSDGTDQGTLLVKDIRPGGLDAALAELTNVGGLLYFTADDGMNGLELWKSDGTAAGTVMVKDIVAGVGGSNPSQLTNVGGTLFFTADDGSNGIELWMSDGTDVGTVMVKDIQAGAASSNPLGLTNVGGTLFFSANRDASGDELWKSNGLDIDTVLLEDVNVANTTLGEITDVDGDAFFVQHWPGGDSLWVSNGTPGGAELLEQGAVDQQFNQLTNVNGTLLFAFRTDIDQPVTLWKSDGTESGTELVKSFPGSSFGGFMSGLTNVNGTLFFLAINTFTPQVDAELFKSDGTEAGTVLVKEIRPGNEGSFPLEMTNVDGTLFFSANDGVNGRQLWKSDGSEAGTQLVELIGSGANNTAPMNFASFADELFFAGNDGVNGYELWKSDGSAVGTFVVRPLGTVSLPYGDDFSRPDGTSLGDNWIETDGDLGITNTKVVPFANTVSTVVLNNLDVADVTLSANVDLAGAEVGRSIALIARSQGPDDTNAYWGVYFRSDSGFAAQIYKNIGGVSIPLRSVNVSGPAGNLRFEVFGTTLNLYFDDVLVTSVIDNSLTLAGAAGIRQSGGALDQFAAVVPTPPPTQNVVLPFTDNFNRPNSGFLGPFWTEHTGDAGIVNNSIGLYANDTTIVTANGINESDVSVSADFDVSTTPEQYSSGLIARYGGPGDQDFYLARIFHSGGNSFAAQIWKNVGGVYTPLRSVSVAGGAGNLRFDVVGNQLALYFNGSLVASTIDASIAGPGQVGLRLAGGTVDNFVAEELTPPPISNATLPFDDYFDRADSSSLGEFWTEQAGDLGITDNVMVLYAEATSIATLNGVSEADVDVFASINTLNGGNNGLLARYSGPGDSNAYMAMLQRHNHIISAQIWKNTGGGRVNLSHTEWGLATSPFYTLRFRLEGNHLTLLLNGNLVGDVLDNDIAGPGSVGVRQSSGEIYYFSAATI